MDEKIRRKNLFLTDKMDQKAFGVGGLFYPIIFYFANKNFSSVGFCAASLISFLNIEIWLKNLKLKSQIEILVKYPNVFSQF